MAPPVWIITNGNLSKTKIYKILEKHEIADINVYPEIIIEEGVAPIIITFGESIFAAILFCIDNHVVPRVILALCPARYQVVGAEKPNNMSEALYQKLLRIKNEYVQNTFKLCAFRYRDSQYLPEHNVVDYMHYTSTTVFEKCTDSALWRFKEFKFVFGNIINILYKIT